MTKFKIYDATDAPAESREHLEKIKQEHGDILNVHGVMAESPAMLKGYIALTELFDKVTLNEQERSIVLLVASHENGSHYCATVYSQTAANKNVSRDVIEAIRIGVPLKDKGLETLRSFTAKAVNCRGQVSQSDIRGFLDAGYTRANILEI